MSSVLKEIYANQLAATNTTLYTVPANRTLLITRATLLNTTGTDRTVDLHLVTSGGSASVANQILDAKTCESNMTEPYLIPGLERQILEGGGTIQASASAASAVTLVISGILITTSSS